MQKIRGLIVFLILLMFVFSSYSEENFDALTSSDIFSGGELGADMSNNGAVDGSAGVYINIDLDKSHIVSGQTMTGEVAVSSEYALSSVMKISITNICIEGDFGCSMTEYYVKEYPFNIEMNGVHAEELSIPITISEGEYYFNVEIQNVFNPSDPMQNSVVQREMFYVEPKTVQLDYENSYIFSDFYMGFTKTPIIPQDTLVNGLVRITSENFENVTLLIGMCELDNKLCTSGYVSKIETRLNLKPGVQDINYEIKTPESKDAWNIRYMLKNEQGAIFSTFVAKIITVESLIDISEIKFNKGKAYVNIGETGYYSLIVSKKYEGSNFDLKNIVITSRVTDLNTNQIVTEQESSIREIDSDSIFEKEYTFVVKTPLYNYQVCAEIKDSKDNILSSKCYSKNNEEFSKSIIDGIYYRIDYDFECNDEQRIFDTLITVSAYDKTKKPISFQGLIMIKDLFKSSLVKREIIATPSTNYLINTQLRPEREYELIFTDDLNKQNVNLYISFPKNCELLDEVVQKETTLILPGNILSKEGENCSYLISKDKLKDVSSILCDDVENYVEKNIENIIDADGTPVIVDTEVFKSQFVEKKDEILDEKILEVVDAVEKESHILRNIIVLIGIILLLTLLFIYIKKRNLLIFKPVNNNQQQQYNQQQYQNQQQQYLNQQQQYNQQQYQNQQQYPNQQQQYNQQQNQSNYYQNNNQRRENE